MYHTMSITWERRWYEKYTICLISIERLKYDIFFYTSLRRTQDKKKEKEKNVFINTSHISVVTYEYSGPTPNSSRSEFDNWIWTDRYILQSCYSTDTVRSRRIVRITCVLYMNIMYVDYSHFMSPNRGVEGYIRLANSRDDRHPPLPPPPSSQPFATAAVGRKHPKHKSKSSMSLIKPNRKQFTQVCTCTAPETPPVLCGSTVAGAATNYWYRCDWCCGRGRILRAHTRSSSPYEKYFCPLAPSSSPAPS